MATERGYGHLLLRKNGGGAISRVYGGSPHIIDAALRNKRLEENKGSRDDVIQSQLSQQLRAIEKRKSQIEKELHNVTRDLCRNTQWVQPKPKKQEVEAAKETDIDYIPTAFEVQECGSVERASSKADVNNRMQKPKRRQLKHRKSSSFGNISDFGLGKKTSLDNEVKVSAQASSTDDVFETSLEINAKNRQRTPPPLLRRLSRSHNDIDDLDDREIPPERKATTAFEAFTKDPLDQAYINKATSSDDVHISSGMGVELDETDFFNNSMKRVKQMDRRHSRVTPAPGVAFQKLSLPQRPHTAHNYNRSEKQKPLHLDDDYDMAVARSDYLIDQLSTSPNPESELKNDFPNRVKHILSQYDVRPRPTEREE